MKKAASVTALLLLWVLATGCESQGTPARVHLRVFEVPMQVLRLQTSEQNPYKLADSAYSVSTVTPGRLNSMLRSPTTESRVLADTTRVVNDWPAATDTWVYSPRYDRIGPESMYSGGGAGSLGVRERGGHLELRLDYIVNHRGPQGERLVESKIFYEYRYPEGQVLLFHTPVDTSGGNPRLHVIAFEVTRNGSSSESSDSTKLPADILAYR